MAYHLWDGFDNYNGSTELWPVVNGSPAYSSSFARFSAPSGLLGQGMKCGPGAVYKQWNMASNQPTMIFGFAMFLPQLNGPFMFYQDSGTAQCRLAVDASGAIILQSGNLGGTIASSAPGVISTNTWYWLDIQITINNTTGAIAVYVNEPAGGPPVLSATGLNTRSSSNNFMNNFILGDTANHLNGAQFDDFHAHDTTGSAPNAILGDSRIYTKKANGAGFATTWTPNGAAANWQCSDDSPPDGDTTYNSSNTPGAIEGYAVPSAGFTVVPNGLVRRSYLRRDDAGPHTFNNGIRSGSTNSFGVTFTVPSTYSWADGQTAYVLDPATGSAWTAVAADAAQMIIEETT